MRENAIESNENIMQTGNIQSLKRNLSPLGGFWFSIDAAGNPGKLEWGFGTSFRLSFLVCSAAVCKGIKLVFNQPSTVPSPGLGVVRNTNAICNQTMTTGQYLGFIRFLRFYTYGPPLVDRI